MKVICSSVPTGSIAGSANLANRGLQKREALIYYQDATESFMTASAISYLVWARE